MAANKANFTKFGWVYGGMLIVAFVLAAIGWIAQDSWLFAGGVAVLLITIASMLTYYWAIAQRSLAIDDPKGPAVPKEQLAKLPAPMTTAQNARLLAIINSISEAIIAVDAQGIITLYNAATLELLDSHADIAGQQIQKTLPFTCDGKEFDPLSVVLQTAGMVVRDDVVFQQGGRQVNLYVAATPTIDNGQISGAIIQARDVSKQKTLEAQKDEFLSVISHELRTPVAIVDADLSTALMPGFATIPPKAHKLLTNARKNLSFLAALLQDISDLSHSDRMVLDTELRKLVPAKFAQAIVNDCNLPGSKAYYPI